MIVTEAHDQRAWDEFLAAQTWSPFLQSFAMGEVFRDIGEKPVRLEARENGAIVAICQAIIVPARRGRHLAVLYGPVLGGNREQSAGNSAALWSALRDIAADHRCTFIRVSPFWESSNAFAIPDALPSPLHLLAERIAYVKLRGRSEVDLFRDMRQNHRNLIRRAERDGVTVEASRDFESDLHHFFRLYEETRKRHHFVPYSEAFVRAQVKRFSEKNECTVYLARYHGEVLAVSVHMHVFCETSYHHGASSSLHPKIPASYALQWRAMRDALHRGDRVFNLWGIAPEGAGKHPFAGVTTFKTGFGGEILTLQHCMDIPLSKRYAVTRAFETFRKWKRGF